MAFCCPVLYVNLSYEEENHEIAALDVSFLTGLRADLQSNLSSRGECTVL